MMDSRITIALTKAEKTIVERALEAYADELRYLSEQPTTRYFSQGFAADARDVSVLLERVRQTVEEEKMIERVKEYLRGGMKINGIKFVRTVTGWGLKEAKEYVDKIEANSVL